VVSKVRVQRIADRIREELSDLLIKEIQDPRLSGVSITDVTVDRELDYANVYVSAIEGSQRAAEILAALRHAQGFLRSELARRIQLRSFPRLRFHWDPTYERAEKIEHLMASLHEGEQAELPGDQASAADEAEAARSPGPEGAENEADE
jgi:ribosome-binding factor A